MPRTTPLRIALLANALFAAATGTALLVAPGAVAVALGIDPHPLLAALGGGLLVFATDLVHQATRARLRTWRAAYATLLDLGWVAASAVLLATSSAHLSETGVVLVASIGVAVLAFAAAQTWGIDRAHRLDRTDRYHHCVATFVDVPADALWPIVADLGEIHRFVPSLERSALVGSSGPSVGAVRACTDRAGRSWTEECVAFAPGEVALRFRADAPGFPFPATSMEGGWTVEPQGRGSLVRVWWTLTPRPRRLATLVMPLFAFAADREIPEVVRRMAVEALARTGRSLAEDRTRPAATVRALGEPCAAPR
jgi:hypothetical protein